MNSNVQVTTQTNPSHRLVMVGNANPSQLTVYKPMNASRTDFSKCDVCCKTETLRKCANCHTAIYCGRECQTAAWADHKKICKQISDSAHATTSTKYRVAIESGGTIEVSKKAELVIGNDLTTKIDLKLKLSDFDFTLLTNNPKFNDLKSLENEEITNLPQITEEIGQWIEKNSKGLVGHEASMSMIMVLHSFVRPYFQEESTDDTLKIFQKTHYKILRNTKVYHLLSNCPLPIENVVSSWKDALKTNMEIYAKLLKNPLLEIRECTSFDPYGKAKRMVAQEVLTKIMRICIVLFPSATLPANDISRASVHANNWWDLYRPQEKLNQLHDVYDEVLIAAESLVKDRLNDLSGGKMRTLETCRSPSKDDDLNFTDFEIKK